MHPAVRVPSKHHVARDAVPRYWGSSPNLELVADVLGVGLGEDGTAAAATITWELWGPGRVRSAGNGLGSVAAQRRS